MGAALLTLLSSPFRFLKSVFQSQASRVTVNINESSVSIREPEQDAEYAKPDSPQRFSFGTQEFSSPDGSLQLGQLQSLPNTRRMDIPAEVCPKEAVDFSLVCNAIDQSLPDAERLTTAGICMEVSEGIPLSVQDVHSAYPPDDECCMDDSEGFPPICVQDTKDLHKASTVYTYCLSPPLTPDHIVRKCDQNLSKTYIQTRFGKMFTETYKLLQARYSLIEFKTHLMKISPSDEVSKMISQAESYAKALIAVHHLWSWDNCCVFRELVLAFGDLDAIQQLDLYDQELIQYLADKKTCCDHQPSHMGLSCSDYWRQDNVTAFPRCRVPAKCQNSIREDDQESTNHPGFDQGNWDCLSYPSFTDRRSSNERPFIQNFYDDKLRQKSNGDLFCEGQYLKSPSWYHNMAPSNKTPETV